MDDKKLIILTSCVTIAALGMLPFIKTVIRWALLIIGFIGLCNLPLLPLDELGNIAVVTSIQRYDSLIQFINTKCNLALPALTISIHPRSQKRCKKLLAYITHEFGKNQKKRYT